MKVKTMDFEMIFRIITQKTMFLSFPIPLLLWDMLILIDGQGHKKC